MLVLALLIIFAAFILTSLVHWSSLMGVLIILAIIGAGIDKWRSMFR